MSVEAITWALRVPVGGNAKVILLGLANHAHPDGTNAYPALDTLAEYAACHRATARRNLRELEEAGYIEREGEGPKGQHRWRLMIGGRKTRPVAPASEGGDTGVREGVAPVLPEPSMEPSNRTGDTKSANNAADSLPDDFPEELKPHARVVYRLLVKVAEQHGARVVKPLALGRVMMGRPRKPFVKAAHDFAAWAADPPRPIRDVVASYRRWIEQEKDLQTTERLSPRNAAEGRKRFTRED